MDYFFVRCFMNMSRTIMGKLLEVMVPMDTTRVQIRPLLSNYACTIIFILIGVGGGWDEAQL
jgi:hypothetical protein